MEYMQKNTDIFLIKNTNFIHLYNIKYVYQASNRMSFVIKSVY